MIVGDILEIIRNIGGFHSIFVPEFTYEDLRIDAILIDTTHRLIRGFEIKTSLVDFNKDDKWTLYSRFCSSLCIVCPEDLIKKEDVKKPFGLIYASEKVGCGDRRIKWIKRPMNFQKRNSLAWLWAYVRVLETEFKRMSFELDRIKSDYKTLHNNYIKLYDV